MAAPCISSPSLPLYYTVCCRGTRRRWPPRGGRSRARRPPAGPRRRYSVALQPGELEQFVQVVEEPQGDCGLETLTVVCPEGVSAGDLLYVSTPDGDEVEVAVPEGVGPGDEFEVQLGGAAGDDLVAAESGTEGQRHLSTICNTTDWVYFSAGYD